MLIDELVEFWAETDPVSGYMAGLKSCQGKLFLPTPAALEQVRQRIVDLRGRLGEITDADLRESGAKLLDCIETGFATALPTQQVNGCANGVFGILVRNDQTADFVANYLDLAETLVSIEAGRWAGQTHTIEIGKLCREYGDFLQATLAILEQQNPNLAPKIAAVNVQIEKYKQLFYVEGIDTDDFAELFALFERYTTGPTATAGYTAMLKDLYDYQETATQIEMLSLNWLDQELPIVHQLAAKLAAQYGMPADSSIEQVYDAMGKHYAVGPDVIGVAQTMMSAIEPYTAEYILDTSQAKGITLGLPPDYLQSLITSGATNLMNYLTHNPDENVYLSPDRNQSRMTMINVLVHEYAHAYQASLCSQQPLPDLLKLETTLMIPLAEALAFHREWEFYAAAAELLNRPNLNPVEKNYLAIFGADAVEQAQGVLAFEMETRIWRVIRFLRAVCDASVNLGERSYVDFVNWAHDHTQLSREFIHNECFEFFGQPGYTPSYAVCGALYGDLQAEKLDQGVSIKSFNTQACDMGVYPWPIAVVRMGQFKAV